MRPAPPIIVPPIVETMTASGPVMADAKNKSTSIGQSRTHCGRGNPGRGENCPENSQPPRPVVTGTAITCCGADRRPRLGEMRTKGEWTMAINFKNLAAAGIVAIGTLAGAGSARAQYFAPNGNPGPFPPPVGAETGLRLVLTHVLPLF